MSIFRKVHNAVVNTMSKSWIVENVLIAKVKEDDGQYHDCIYCTIIRNAVIFFVLGYAAGKFMGA